jgi:TRAP-type C4-dicarboxylate transport system permease small subunit
VSAPTSFPADEQSLFARIDHGLYRIERALAGVLFVIMSLVMFLYVIERVTTHEPGRLPMLVMGIFRKLGGTVGPEREVWFNGPFSTGLNLGILLLVAYAALRTMKLARPLARGPALGGAAVVMLAIAGLVKLIIWYFPNGLLWGPTFALCCMLWIGFLGASLATYEKRHLALEMGEKIWPKPIFHYVKALSLVVAGLMAIFLCYLAYLSVKDYRAAWVFNPRAGNLLPTSIPKWTMLLVLPYAFTVMTVRFLGQAARVIKHPEEAAAVEAIPGLPTDAPEGGS